MKKPDRNWSLCFATAVLAGMLLILPAAAFAQRAVPPVTVSEATMRDVVQTVRLSGTVVAPRSAQISTALGGLVDRVTVDIGDVVKEGDVLVELDTELVRLEVQTAEAALKEAEAELREARRRLRVANRLAKKGSLPGNEREARAAQVQIAEAAVQRLKAEAARQRARLDQHTIPAPFDGVVARKRTEAGEWVSPGTPVADLVANDNLRVDVPVPQRYFPKLKSGAPMTLRFDALPEETFKAETVALVPVSDPTARTFTLRVRAARGDIPLTPGMSALVSIQLSEGKRGIVIPRDAVIRYPDGRTTVWVIEQTGENTTVEERQVNLGQADDGRVHILAGLETGQRVVVRGNEALRAGQRVRVIETASQPGG